MAVHVGHCYDCGRKGLTYEPGVNAEVCDHCAEILQSKPRRV